MNLMISERAAHVVNSFLFALRSWDVWQVLAGVNLNVRVQPHLLLQ